MYAQTHGHLRSALLSRLKKLVSLIPKVAKGSVIEQVEEDRDQTAEPSLCGKQM